MNSGPINQSIGGEVLPGVKTVTSHGSPTGKGLHGQRVQSKRESIWRLVGELDADFAANDTGVWDNLTGTGDDDEEVECIAGGPQYYTVDGRPPILEYGSVNVVYLRGHIEVTVSHLLSQDRFLVDVDNISTQDLAFFENDEGNIQTSNAADLQRVFSTFPQHAVSDNVIAAERNSECNTAGAPSPGYHWSPLHGEDASSLPMLPTPSETVDTSSDNTDKVNFTVAEAFKCLDFNTFFATLARKGNGSTEENFISFPDEAMDSLTLSITQLQMLRRGRRFMGRHVFDVFARALWNMSDDSRASLYITSFLRSC